MVAGVVILDALVLSALIVTLVWCWRSTDALDQLTERSRIRFEEQLALWRIQAILRQAQEEMRRIRDTNRPRSLHDRES